VWEGGSPPAGLLHVEALLDATSTIKVATGIVNVWTADALTVARSYHRIEAAHPGRFLLGIGVGHPEAIARYHSPYQTLVDYLDVLDDAGVPVERRILAALGPRVLRLAAARTAGAHPTWSRPSTPGRPAPSSARARSWLPSSGRAGSGPGPRGGPRPSDGRQARTWA